MEKVFQQTGVGERAPFAYANIGTALLSQTMERPALATPEARRGHLESVPAGGFESQAEYTGVVDDIVTIGLPVHNIRSLTKRRNQRETEGVLGSWGTGHDNYGDFSVYGLLDQLPQKRLTTLTHEGLHANSPLDTRNDRLYGGRAERRKAIDFAVGVAEQSLMTGKYIDGYQKYLASQYMQGLIDGATFVEETLAITGEQAMTNRKHLEQVQEAQRSIFLRARAQGYISPQVQFTELLSRPAGTQTRLTGVDAILTKLIDGAHDYQSLTTHAEQLKERFGSRLRPEAPVPRSEQVIIIIPLEWLLEWEEALRSQRRPGSFIGV